MTDAPDVTPVPEQPSDGTQNTDAKPPTAKEPVPYLRFSEVNREKNEALKQLKELQDAEAARQAQARKDEEEKQIKAGEFEKVLADLRPKAERLERLEKFIQARFAKALESVPEDMRDLVPPGLDIETAWAWLETAQSKGAFKKPDVPNLNAGERGEHGKPLVDAKDVLKKRSY